MSSASWAANLRMVEQYIFRLIETAETAADYRDMERVLTQHLHYCLTRQNQLREQDAATTVEPKTLA